MLIYIQITRFCSNLKPISLAPVKEFFSIIHNHCFPLGLNVIYFLIHNQIMMLHQVIYIFKTLSSFSLVSACVGCNLLLIETKLLHLRGSLKLLYANKVGCGFSFVGIPSTKCREHTCINDIIRYIVVLQKNQGNCKLLKFTLHQVEQ